MKTLTFVVFIIIAHTSVAQTKKIIFVCEHGAGKSVIAASYFNKLAKERNLDYVAECRGTDPDSVVGPVIKEGLTKENVFDPNTRPRKLTISDTVNVEKIILFTPLPADIKTDIQTENWSNIQNVDADYKNRRDAIIRQINQLLDKLEKRK